MSSRQQVGTPSSRLLRGTLKEMSRANEIESWTFGVADGVPSPVAPYAHATAAGSWVYATGQLPIVPETGLLAGETISEQTHQVLLNLKKVLDQVGSGIDRCVMIRAYLTSMDDYAEFNTAYATWFPLRLPSRTCIGVTGLALGAKVEIDAVALLGQDDAANNNPPH